MRQEAARRAEQKRIAEAKRREANEREKRVKRLNELLAEKEVLLKLSSSNDAEDIYTVSSLAAGTPN